MNMQKRTENNQTTKPIWEFKGKVKCCFKKGHYNVELLTTGENRNNNKMARQIVEENG